MRTLIKNGIVYRDEEQTFAPLDLLVEGEVIVAIAERGDLDGESCSVLDCKGRAILPGLVDVHTHGRDRLDFTRAHVEDVSAAAAGYAAHGVTTIMPTIASAPLEVMTAAAHALLDLPPIVGGANICGVHLEGRYLEAKKRGAHAQELLAPLAPDELALFAPTAGKALHISAAYELDTDGAFAKRAVQMGATLGLAHTCATYAQARRAEQRGVASYTHLFNAMPPLHHREGGAVCACLTGDAFAELICDGIHVSPEMVALAYACKGSSLVLVSDSMEATGCPDGEYSIAGNAVRVEGGRALTLDGALAGSTLTLDAAVQNLMDFCAIPLSRAILCATRAPAMQVGIFDSCGSIDVGKRADLLLAAPDESRLCIEQVILRGRAI